MARDNKDLSMIPIILALVALVVAGVAIAASDNPHDDLDDIWTTFTIDYDSNGGICDNPLHLTYPKGYHTIECWMTMDNLGYRFGGWSLNESGHGKVYQNVDPIWLNKYVPYGSLSSRFHTISTEAPDLI